MSSMPSRRVRFIAALSIILGVALSATPSTSGIASTSRISGHHGAGLAITSPKPVPKFHGKLPPPRFADVVNTIDAAKYPRAFAGIVAAPRGMLTIYVVRSRAAAFVAALRRQAHASHSGTSRYRLVPVAHSWAQLLAVTARINAQYRRLRAEGIKLAQWGPDEISNKVKVTLAVKDPAMAKKVLNQFGRRWVTVATNVESWTFTAADRYHDVSPFFGGDTVWFPGQDHTVACTAAFAYLKNGSTFSETASHCVKNAGASSGDAVFTNIGNRQTYGHVATQYLDSHHFDVASISGNFNPHVWGDNGTTYSVVGTQKPLRGDLVTADGRLSGEVRGVTVENVDQDIPVEDCGCTIVFATTATKNGATVCQVGDSGGPWYVHNNTASEVFAAGIQSAERQDPNGNLDPSVCIYEQIRYWLNNITGGTIMTVS